MSTQIQFLAFNFKASQVRVITDPNQEFWFCGKDVCDILGYANDSKALKDHCKAKGVTKRYSPTPSGNQEMVYINEPNLYRLIIKSRKPEAEPFEAWVFEEVLPQIRKTGKYEKRDNSVSLTKEHQQFIKDFVMNRTLQLPKDKQAKGAIMQWSALRSHFGKSYKEIDDGKFIEAVSLLARLPIEGELIEPLEDNINIKLSHKEIRDLINVWFWFTCLSDSVEPLLKAVKPFVFGNLYSLPEYQLRNCNNMAKISHPTIKKLLELLPKEQLLHSSRERISNLFN